MSRWAIYLTATGELIQTFVSATHPRFNGFAWDGTKHTATAIADDIDPAVLAWSPTSKAFIENLPALREVLIDRIKSDAEQLKMKNATPGGFKKTEYAAKEREVNAWESLGGTVSAILVAFNLMPVARRTVTFPYILASAAEFGDTPADAVARIKAGIAKAAANPRIAAKEERVTTLIRNATSAAAARAAAVVVWPT